MSTPSFPLRKKRRLRLEFNKKVFIVPILLLIIGTLLMIAFYDSNHVIALIGGLIAFVGIFVLFFLSLVIGYYIFLGAEMKRWMGWNIVKDKKRKALIKRLLIIVILGVMNGTILASIKLLSEAGFTTYEMTNTLMLFAPIFIMMYSVLILERIQDGLPLLFATAFFYIIITLLAWSVPIFFGLINLPTFYIAVILNHLISTLLLVFPLLLIGYIFGFMIKGFGEVLKTLF